jgi:putative ABC transport system substrate-binding protein
VKNYMQRRDVIALVGGVFSWPILAHAQQKAMPMIGFLGVSSLEKMGGGVLLDFKRGLAETGYVEDHNVRIEYRWAEDHYDRLPALAMELVQRHVKVLAAPGSPAALPARAATAIIPIVFMVGSDPVQLGLVASLNRPGGNLTGYAYLNDEIAQKRLELLHDLLPAAKSIALLVNPANPSVAAAQAKGLQGAADALGVRLTVVGASNAIELEDVFVSLVRDRIDALQLGVDPLFGNHIDQIIALATRSKIPTIYRGANLPRPAVSLTTDRASLMLTVRSGPIPGRF